VRALSLEQLDELLADLIDRFGHSDIVTRRRGRAGLCEAW
jgi:hypothetical protein